ncbi:signal-regulatory protein beta-2-like [Acanthochromis polyacanthus]|uniref:signal-regulatory protein beta-2-like n=1 Tax=Acanthochromis polyacanthus TaxID=80966 RepID=UPI0022345397|nr:signal-regulatory protein beta-2-like [Acanthochromis polyacanthus]
MIVLWITLLVLHQGYTLIPVIPVQIGESTNLTCALSNKDNREGDIHWFKQSVGDNLKLIVTQWKYRIHQYAPEFNNSRWKVNSDDNFTNLTILRTIQEDEGIYHCAFINWLGMSKSSGIYLIIKGDGQKTSDYTVVQSTASHSVHPGESQTLQCSVFSDSDKKTCSGDLSVFWFRPGSDKSHPDIIYTDGNRPDECEKRSDTQKSCVYRSSKTFSSSDAGTYYCAVATCGQILFGNGTTLTNDACLQTAQSEMIALVVAIICLAISVIVNIVLIRYRTSRAAQEQFTGIEFTSSQARHDNLSQPGFDTTEGGHDLNYAALHFSGKKAKRGKKKMEMKTEESVYSQVKCEL